MQQPSPSYDEDFYAWTQHQAKLLRALQNLRSDFPAEMDIPNIAEEIESLGSADLNSVRSYVRNILVHLIKAASDQKAPAVGHWRSEIATFHLEALDRYTASMRQLIDIQRLWRDAIKLANLRLLEHGHSVAPSMPAQCPFSIDEIMAENFDVDTALAVLTRMSDD